MATAGFIFAPQGKLPHQARWPEEKLRRKFGGFHDGGPLQLEQSKDVANLLAYALYHSRERYRRIARPTGSGTTGFILNKGAHREFEFAAPEKVSKLPWSRGYGGTLQERREKFHKEKDFIPWRHKKELPSLWGPADELDACVDAIEFCGGELLAIWTHVDHVHLLRAEAPNPLGGVHISRISIPMVGDQIEHMQELEKFLDHSMCFKSLKQLKKTLEAVRFSPANFFSAFGLPGASNDGVKENPWKDYLLVAYEHLAGEPANPARIKLLNEFIRKAGGGGLRAKPIKTPESRAAELSWALSDLISQLGRPTPLELAEDLTLAKTWSRLAEDNQVPECTREKPNDPRHASVAAGQVLSCFPKDRARDGLFLVMLGGELEEANSLDLALTIWKLACHTETAGMTVLAFPAADEKKFRRAFKLKGGAFPAQGDWKAAAFIDLPGKRRKPIEELAAAKFGDKPYILIRLEPDGTITGLTEEIPWDTEPDLARLRPAAIDLDARGAASALGFRH